MIFEESCLLFAIISFRRLEYIQHIASANQPNNDINNQMVSDRDPPSRSRNMENKTRRPPNEKENRIIRK